MSNYQRHLHLPAVYRHGALMPPSDAVSQQEHERHSESRATANAVAVSPSAPQAPLPARCNANDIQPSQPSAPPPPGDHGLPIPVPHYNLNMPRFVGQGQPQQHRYLPVNDGHRHTPAHHPPSYGSVAVHAQHHAAQDAYPIQPQSQLWHGTPPQDYSQHSRVDQPRDDHGGGALHAQQSHRQDLYPVHVPYAPQPFVAHGGHTVCGGFSGQGTHAAMPPHAVHNSLSRTSALYQSGSGAPHTPPASASQALAATAAATASPPGSSCFVGNIPPDITSDYLQSLFGSICPQALARIHRDKRYAFVTLASPSAAHEAAQRLNGLDVGGRLIRVEVTQRVPRYVLQQQLTFEHIQQHTHQFRMAQQHTQQAQQRQHIETQSNDGVNNLGP